MKIRQGFVSNSSSSSFVLLVSIEEYQKVKATKNPLLQVIMDTVMTKTDVLGKKCMMYEYFSDIGGYNNLDDIEAESIVHSAKELAQTLGVPIVEDDLPDDEEERNYILESFAKENLFEIAGLFSSDKTWHNRMDW